MTENEKQQLQKLNEKIEKLKTQQQIILAREKTRERKEKTKTLIKYGKLIDKYFNSPKIEKLETLLKYLINIEAVKDILKD